MDALGLVESIQAEGYWCTAGTTRSRRGGSWRRGRASLEAKSWELLNGHRLLLWRRLLLSLGLNNPAPQDRCNLISNFFRSTVSKMHKRCAHFSRKVAPLPCNPDLLNQVGRIRPEIRHALHQVRSFPNLESSPGDSPLRANKTSADRRKCRSKKM